MITKSLFVKTKNFLLEEHKTYDQYTKSISKLKVF